MKAVNDSFDVLEASVARDAATESREAAPRPQVTIPPDKVSYSVKEAGKALGVSTGTIWRLLELGSLGSFKLGARRLISAEQLRSFLAKNGG